MRRFGIGFALLVVSMAGSIVAQTHGVHAVGIEAAIASGQITEEITGTGGSSGDSLRLRIAKRPKAGPGPLEIDIPIGSLFKSSDPGAQNMMFAGVRGVDLGGGMFRPVSKIVLADNNPVTFILSAFCAQFEKENPSATTSFSIGDQDLTLACIARRGKPLSVGALQSAVWIYTDGLTFEHMSQKFTVTAVDWASAQNVVEACRGAVPGSSLGGVADLGGGKQQTHSLVTHQEKPSVNALTKSTNTVPLQSKNPEKRVDASASPHEQALRGILDRLGDQSKASEERSAAVCRTALTEIRPLAEAEYGAAEWLLALSYLKGRIGGYTSMDAPRQSADYAKDFFFCSDPTLLSNNEGFIWLERAANHGVRGAIEWLAFDYAMGESVTIDLPHAYALYDLLSWHHSKDRDCLSKIMSVEDIERARSLKKVYQENAQPLNFEFVSVIGDKPGWNYCDEDYQQVLNPTLLNQGPYANYATASAGTPITEIASALVKVASAVRIPLPEFDGGKTKSVSLGRDIVVQQWPSLVANLEVRNETQTSITIFIRGSVSRSLRISAGSSGIVKLFPGTYEMAAISSIATTIPSYGIRTVNGSFYKWTVKP